MLTVPEKIKELLHRDSCPKNIRIHFPNGERSDICNDLIVKDSVSFTESLCSQDQLKFGLCESPVFECETVGVGNIKGATIEVSCEVYCDADVSGAEWRVDLQHNVYVIPYGVFVVDEAKRQADMIHRKIVAYGGVASHDWNLPEIEIRKMLTSSMTTYTPSLFYLMNECGIRFPDSFFNESTPEDYVDTPTLISSYDFDIGDWRVHFDIFGVGFYNASPQAIYRFRYRVGNPDYITIRSRAKGKMSDAEIERVFDDIKDIVSKPLYLTATNIAYFEHVEKPSNDPEDFIVYPYINNSKAYGYIALAVRFNLEAQNLVSGISFFATSQDIHKLAGGSIKKCTLKDEYSQLGAYNAYPIGVIKTTEGNVTAYHPDWTTYDFQSDINSWLERRGYFGYFGRDDKFKMVNIKDQFLRVPSTDLYPSNYLYPQGVTGGKLLPQDYQSCWYDDDYTKPFGAVQCTYTNTSNEECFAIYYLTGFDENSDPNSYRIYDFSNNILAKSKTWTEADVLQVCQMIAENIEGVTYMPVEFVGRGLPYVEAGDTFEILTKSNDSITTIVLNRTITGEMTLTDSYKSV